MHHLTLKHAEAILDGCHAFAAEKGLKPLTIAVLDGGGALIAMKRQDGAMMAGPLAAQGKANGALHLGRSSRKVEAVAEQRPSFMAALAAQIPIVPVTGAVVIQGADNRIIGAVGVSGDTADNDEAAALAGIAAAGLTAMEP